MCIRDSHGPEQSNATTAEFLRSHSDVLPAITHELRTPLTVLMGYVQLLQRRLRTGSILEERNLRALHTIPVSYTHLGIS